MPMTFILACRQQLMVPGEEFANFAAGFKRLTEQDKKDLREQFTREFGYAFAEPVTPS